MLRHSRLPAGLSFPRGLREIGGRLYLDGSRIRYADELEILLDGGRWERGHYWKPLGAPWASFVSAERWIVYIVGGETVIRQRR